ncbi:hypothetical protein CI109_105662 [Kwoniella shandongensis]|uniref:Decapping nuclease n=1 Tax=Kwoniella shandongensis TaxID=1734106 RepID=A0A5M6C177_9TREE|nr:uncharacterized protein CI109_003003 [Kwoniella shandongensis]KAA5528471.1 hypothetical protein CI109_003003 [Kwoniella shandongensis]
MAYRPPPPRQSAEASSSSTPLFLPLPPLFQPLPPPPPYHSPTLISTYSHSPDRSIVHDDTSMAYYRPAPMGCDLKYGFERRIERDEEVEEHLDGLCEALQTVGEGRGERKGGVITWRGMITRIMTAPFEDRDGWEMTAIALDGSVYLEEHDPPESKANRRKQQSSWALPTYMGYAFESFSTVSRDGEEAESEVEGWGGDVNTNVQWCNVVRSAIGEIPLCLGGEVDCVRAEIGSPHPGLERTVELKTNKVIENERQDAVFHKKLLKHWAQSWLLGVPEIQVGFRDDAGIVKSQKGFETESIPRLIASLPHPPWSTPPTLHFLHAVLSLLLTHVLPTDPLLTHPQNPSSDLPPATVWRLRFVPRKGCELYKVGEVGMDANGRWGGLLKEDYVRWRLGRARS